MASATRFEHALNDTHYNIEAFIKLPETLQTDRQVRRFPERKVIITVSPVALSRTFSDSDVITANTESNSILRAVAGALSRAFPNVIYWPSYEIALAQDVYEEDGRHVTREGVEQIVNQFVAVHVA
jgi:hypothetical protein